MGRIFTVRRKYHLDDKGRSVGQWMVNIRREYV